VRPTSPDNIILFNEQHWWPPVKWCTDRGILTGAYIDYYTEATIPLFANYDFLICNTKRHFSAFDWHPQAFYVPWGTDVNLFKPTSTERVDSNRVVFFQSCGFSPARKGTDFVLRAFSQLKDKNSSLLRLHSQVDLGEKIPELKTLIEPSISSLTDCMQYYVDHADELPRLKSEARAYALKNLNWWDRDAQLNEIFTTSEIIKKASNAAEKIETYERQQSGIRYKVAKRYPFWYGTLQRLNVF